MSDTTLHYFHDPLCGWCYAASPLVAVARSLLELRLHAGGLMIGAGRRPVTPQLRDFVLPHDRRIAQLSGQPFGTAYTEGLLRDAAAVFDSQPPTTAVLAAQQLVGRGAEMLERIQRAHYVEGRRIAEPAVLAELAADLGIDAAAFRAAFERWNGQATLDHIAHSRALLAEVGGQGFPTFVLERDGQRQLVDSAAFLGRPERWREWLSQASGIAVKAAEEEALACTPEGCALPGQASAG